jgi:hypothetical protein
MRRQLLFLSGVLLITPLISTSQTNDLVLSPAPLHDLLRKCDESKSGRCLDRIIRTNNKGEYVGHDEPSLIFYSKKKGSGSSAFYTVKLPKEPPTQPKQDGTGGVYNFQLHPAFWFGMALCDTQSAPNPDINSTCEPGSDNNIFESTDPKAKDYIGKHPGTAFLELQFYPPGWIDSPQLLSATNWFAALNIDSFSFNMNKVQDNNNDCLNLVGEEPVNFAVITKNGVPITPANPLGIPFGHSNFSLANVLVMSGGDTIQVGIFDTPNGLRVTLTDVTTGQSGSMVAGIDEGFGQVNFQPSASTCSVTPYAFHPMYSSSSEQTRIVWAVHTYNIAVSDEIGHFEFCNAFNNNLQCTSRGAFEGATVDEDDFPCANPAFFGLPASFQQITGCVGSDDDFDGVSYRLSWPGTNSAAVDASLHPEPIRFSSAQFLGPGNSGLRDYDRVAFETDLPDIEETCNTSTGAGCTNPPSGALFYPIYSTTSVNGNCMWQFGGPNIPGTTNNFGGNSTAEYGPLLAVAFPFGPTAVNAISDYRRILNSNPCQAGK